MLQTRKDFFGRTHNRAEVLERTAFSKKGVPVLDQIGDVFRGFRELGIEPMLIGGTACMLQSDPRYKKNLTGAHPTDVDMVVDKIPEGVRRNIIERRIIGRQRVEYSGSKVTETLSELDYKVYTLDDRKFPALSKVDLFVGGVCETVIKPEDFDRSEKFTLSGNSYGSLDIVVADPGLLLATMIDPQSATQKRLKRAAYVIVSNGDDASEIGTRYAKIMKRGQVVDMRSFEHIFSQLVRFAKTLKESVVTFAESAQKELLS